MKFPFLEVDLRNVGTMTVAAVARLVHHAVILEIQAESFRKQTAVQQSSSRGFKRVTKLSPSC